MTDFISGESNERRDSPDLRRIYEKLDDCAKGHEDTNIQLVEMGKVIAVTNTNMQHIQEGMKTLTTLGTANQILLAKHDIKIEECEKDSAGIYKMIGDDRKAANTLKGEVKNMFKPKTDTNPIVEVVKSSNFVYVLGLAALALVLVGFGYITTDEIKAIGDAVGE